MYVLKLVIVVAQQIKAELGLTLPFKFQIKQRLSDHWMSDFTTNFRFEK